MKKAANFYTTFFLVLGIMVDLLGQTPSPYDPHTMLITFSSNATNAQIVNLIQLYGATEVDVSPVSSVRRWYVPNFPTPAPLQLSDINEVIQHANAQPEVTGSGLNYQVSSTPPPTVPGSIAPWTSSGLCRFPLVCQNGDTPVKVAVLDTGVGFECAGLSGYYNANQPGYDFVNNDPYPSDDNGHGTHTASIIAKIATLANAPLTVVAMKTHDATGKGELFNIVKAVDLAIQQGVQILNMSFSYNAYNGNGVMITGAYEPNLTGSLPPSLIPTYPKKGPLETAIEVAGQNGLLVVAAAGNLSQNNDAETHPSYPASFVCPNILAVASTDCSRTLSPFSSWGQESVDIGAPGELIEAQGLACQLQVKSGTSQATAVVSGVALQLGSHFNSGPFHYGRVKCAILNSADYVGALSLKLLSKGTVNAPNALYEFLQNDNGCSPKGARPQTTSTTAVAPMTFETSPNPFANALRMRFEVGTDSDAHLTIFDAQGKTMFARAFPADSGPQEVYWEPVNASAGLYSIRLQTSKGVQTSKAVLLR